MTHVVHRLSQMVVIAFFAAVSPGAAQSPWEGLTSPRQLPPFDPSKPSCTPPPDRERALVFARDNDRQFMLGATAGLEAAAHDRGLSFRVEVASNDPKRMIEQVQSARAAKAGAVVAAPINALTLSSSLKSLIEVGSYVGTIVPPPAVSILNAPQYLTGHVLAQAALQYIQSKLGGHAKVVLLTHDSNQYLAQRFVAMRQVLSTLPGVTIVADISPLTVNREGGYETMKKVLIAHPDVDVVLGADTVVLGALKAVRDAKLARPQQFFGGIDGEPEAIAELKRGAEYKATVSLASPIFAYAMGQHAADWLEGKSIPQAMEILPTRLDPRNIASYEIDVANPAAVYRDDAKRSVYLKMYGNICYDTRDQFINFAWSSERK